MAKPKKKKDDRPSIAKFFFGSKRSSAVTVSAICALVVGLSQAVPIAWGWVLDTRDGVEVVVTKNLRIDFEETKAEVEQNKLEQMAMDSRHMNAIQSISKGQQINQETMYNIWQDVRALRGGTTPPRPEPIPTIEPHITAALPHE